MFKKPIFFSKKNFTLDTSGRSPAFFLKNNNLKVDQNFYENLIKFSKINNNINCRICIHKSKKAELHSMIVLINSKNTFNIHRHSKTSETYQLIKGSIQINLFKNNIKSQTIKLKKKVKFLLYLKTITYSCSLTK